MEKDRRQFLRGSGLVLGAVTAGSIVPGGGVPRTPPLTVQRDLEALRQAGVSWEIGNIDNNGADVFFGVVSDMVLASLVMDVAFMITSVPASPGFAEVLCRSGISRGRPPSFTPGPAAGTAFGPSSSFGSVQVSNPSNLGIGFDPYVYEDLLAHVILKTWVPADGTASATYRNLRVEPSLLLDAGDFLFFHMDHLGVRGDVEMQLALGYALR